MSLFPPEIERIGTMHTQPSGSFGYNELESVPSTELPVGTVALPSVGSKSMRFFAGGRGETAMVTAAGEHSGRRSTPIVMKLVAQSCAPAVVVRCSLCL
jgi:hypothetical protein